MAPLLEGTLNKIVTWIIYNCRNDDMCT